jgi:hypothetical protein
MTTLPPEPPQPDRAVAVSAAMLHTLARGLQLAWLDLAGLDTEDNPEWVRDRDAIAAARSALEVPPAGEEAVQPVAPARRDPRMSRLPEPSQPDVCDACGRPLYRLYGRGEDHVHRCADCLRDALGEAQQAHPAG